MQKTVSVRVLGPNEERQEKDCPFCDQKFSVTVQTKDDKREVTISNQCVHYKYTRTEKNIPLLIFDCGLEKLHDRTKVTILNSVSSSPETCSGCEQISQHTSFPVKHRYRKIGSQIAPYCPGVLHCEIQDKYSVIECDYCGFIEVSERKEPQELKFFIEKKDETHPINSSLEIEVGKKIEGYTYPMLILCPHSHVMYIEKPVPRDPSVQPEIITALCYEKTCEYYRQRFRVVMQKIELQKIDS